MRLILWNTEKRLLFQLERSHPNSRFWYNFEYNIAQPNANKNAWMPITCNHVSKTNFWSAHGYFTTSIIAVTQITPRYQRSVGFAMNVVWLKVQQKINEAKIICVRVRWCTFYTMWPHVASVIYRFAAQNNTFDAMLIEKWPIVQAFAHEEIGG